MSDEHECAYDAQNICKECNALAEAGRRSSLAGETGSGQWAYASDPHTEEWKGPYDTKEAATEAALEDYGDPDDGFRPCLSRCRPVRDDDDVCDEHWTFVCVGAVEEIPLPSSPNAEISNERHE